MSGHLTFESNPAILEQMNLTDFFDTPGIEKIENVKEDYFKYKMMDEMTGTAAVMIRYKK